MAYTKLFSTIVTSTIWTEPSDICKVWVTLLALADKHGEVHASIPGLAQVCALTVKTVEEALEKFQSPDPYSRTPDDEGRRIEKIDGGWLLLNHAKYRLLASKDEEKAANAKRQAAFRDRKRRNAGITGDNAKVTDHNGSVTVERDIADTEADTEDVSPTSKHPPLPPKGEELPFDSEEFKAAWESWKSHRKEIRKPLTPTSIKQQMKQFALLGETLSIETIQYTIGKGWQGLVVPESAPKANGTKPPKKFSGHHEEIDVPDL